MVSTDKPVRSEKTGRHADICRDPRTNCLMIKLLGSSGPWPIHRGRTYKPCLAQSAWQSDFQPCSYQHSPLLMRGSLMMSESPSVAVEMGFIGLCSFLWQRWNTWMHLINLDNILEYMQIASKLCDNQYLCCSQNLWLWLYYIIKHTLSFKVGLLDLVQFHMLVCVNLFNSYLYISWKSHLWYY